MADEGPEGEPGIDAIEQYLSRSPVLERVLAVNQPLPGHGGTRVLVSSLELWTSLLVFHEVVTPGMSIATGDRSARSYQWGVLSDDVGNTYPAAGGGGGLVDGLVAPDSPLALDLWIDRPSFRGPVDPEASFLFYEPANAAEGGRCAIELGDPTAGSSDAAPRLSRVVSVNRTLPARAGGRIVVSSVELWSSIIVFNVAVASSDFGQRPDHAETVARAQYTMVLRDDLGNTYQQAAAGGGGGGDPAMQFTVYQAIYHGPVHPDASSLIFRPPETEELQEIDVPLRR